MSDKNPFTYNVVTLNQDGTVHGILQHVEHAANEREFDTPDTKEFKRREEAQIKANHWSERYPNLGRPVSVARGRRMP